MKKRLLALLLAAAMLFSAAPVTAGAADGARIYAGSASGYPGNSVSLYIRSENLADVASLDFYIYYDSEALTLGSASASTQLGGAMVSVNKNTPGTVYVSAATTSPLSGSGYLFYLDFTINEGCKAGDYPITLAVGDAYSSSFAPLTIASTSGKVTVQERPVATQSFALYTTCSPSTLSMGDTASLNVYNSNWRAFAGLDVTVEYDAERFSVESVNLHSDLTIEGAVYSINTNTPGKVRISYTSVEELTPYSLFTVTLKAIADVDATSTVKATVNEAYDIDLVPYLSSSGSTTLYLEKLPEIIDYPNLYLEQAGDAKLLVGEEITTVLKLEADAPVAAADFRVSYDTSVLECLKVEAAKEATAHGGMIVINPNYKSGTVKFSYVNETAYAEGMGLVSITWKLLSSPSAHFEAELSGVKVVDVDQKEIPLEYVTWTDCVYAAVITPATCIEGGYTTHTCAACGDSFTDTPTEAIGHSYGDWYEYTAPGCETEGEERRDCGNCGGVESKWLAATGHSYVDKLCTVCGRPENAIAQGKCGETLFWDLADNGTLVIYGTGDMYGYSRSNPAPWAEFKEQISAVLVQEGAASIGNNAFYEHTAITSVVIPQTLKNLGNYSFYGCTGLTGMSLPAKVTDIGESAFYNCSNLRSITLPDGLQSIGGSAFYYCSSLQEVELPNSLTKIGSFAFTFCDALESIEIPAGVTSLGTMTFYSCRGLKEVTLPEGFTSIGNYLFAGTALQEIIIPASVTSIGNQAFEGCNSLKTVWAYPTVCTVGSNAFGTATTVFCYEDSDVQAYATQNSIPYCAAPVGEALGHSYESVVTPPDCANTGYTTHTCAYCGSSYVDSEVETTAHIYGEWYEYTAPGCETEGEERQECVNCDAYETRPIDPTGHSYGDWYEYAASGCETEGEERQECVNCDAYEIRSIAPTGHSYGQWTQTVAPGCLTEGQERRDCTNCDAYETQSIAAKGHSYADGFCKDCGAPENPAAQGICGDTLYWALTAEGTLVIYGTGDMYSYSGSDPAPWAQYKEEITTVLMQEGATSIGDYALYQHTGFTTIALPQSLTYMGRYCFNECKGLTEISLGDNLENIGYGSFYNCTDLKQIDIPESVTKIEHFAFTFCDSLKTVTIPAGVTSLGIMALEYCDNLETVYAYPMACEIGSQAIGADVTVFCYEGADVQTFAADNGLACCAAPADAELGHSYENVVTPPDCLNSGYTTHTCVRCGNSYTDAETEATGHSYVDGTCSVCGEADPNYVPLFKIPGVSMTLGADLAVYFWVPTVNISNGDCIIITKTYADGRADVVKQIDLASCAPNGAYKLVPFTGISAKEMGDSLFATVYNAEGVATSVRFETSIKQYVLNQFNKAATTDALKTVLADMLNYGAAAQKQFGYDATNLVNTAMSAEQAAYATAALDITRLESVAVKTDICPGITLSLKSSIEMDVFYYTAKLPEGAVMKVSYNNYKGSAKSFEIAAANFATYSAAMKYAIVNTMSAADINTAVTVELYDGDTCISRNQFNVASYCAKHTDSPVVEAMSKYCLSAYDYFMN